MIGYAVNGRFFTNGLDAIDHAARYCPHESVRFVFDDDFWCQQDWRVEISETWDELLDRRAQQLRDKYGYLILYFSGGTDSWLMYQVFRRNLIRIDEIVVVYTNTDTALDALGPRDAVDWIVANHYDPTTKITALAKVTDHSQKIYRSHEKLIASTYVNQPFPVTSNQIWIYRDLLETNAQRRPGIVIGVDKPLIVYEQGRWYVSHLDSVYKLHIPKLDQVEWFYITKDLPTLHIKQAQLSLGHCRAIKPKDLAYWTSAMWSDQDYANWSLACGRRGELFAGNSALGKKMMSQLIESLQNQHTKIARLAQEVLPDVLREFNHRDVGLDMLGYMQRQGLYKGSNTDWHGMFSQKISLSDD